MVSTGDQGEADASGNWRIVGRIKNLIVLGSGHKIAPETVEEEIGRHLPGAQQVVIVERGGYLSAIVTGNVAGEQVQTALDAVNPQLPHYKQVRAFCLRPEAFSIESGMLTAKGKLKRDLIACAPEERDRRYVSFREAGGLGRGAAHEPISRANAVLGV